MPWALIGALCHSNNANILMLGRCCLPSSQSQFGVSMLSYANTKSTWDWRKYLFKLLKSSWSGHKWCYPFFRQSYIRNSNGPEYVAVDRGLVCLAVITKTQVYGSFSHQNYLVSFKILIWVKHTSSGNYEYLYQFFWVILQYLLRHVTKKHSGTRYKPSTSPKTLGRGYYLGIISTSV